MHALEVWHPHIFTHVLIRSSSIPQLFSSHHLPYLQFLDSPHVSLYFQTTKRLCCSSLDLSALLSLIETQLPLSLPVCQSVNQAVSPFTSSSHWAQMPIHKNKKIKNTERVNIQWIEAKAAQQRRAECDSWVCLCSRVASVEFRVRLTVVCGSCRTSERVRGREGGQQHCAVEMSHH